MARIRQLGYAGRLGDLRVSQGPEWASLAGLPVCGLDTLAGEAVGSGVNGREVAVRSYMAGLAESLAPRTPTD